MNKLHLLWKIPLLLIILILIINIFDFVGATRIKVVDALTGESLQNIHVTQKITGKTLSPAGGDDYWIRLLEKMTNSKGIVLFPVKFQIHAPILKIFGKELMRINQHAQDAELVAEFNDNYYSTSKEFGLSHLFPYKSKTIKLIPYVDDLSQCKNNKECRFFNSHDLAFLNNDESYCKNLFLEKGGEFARNKCYSVIALSKLDITLCNQVSEGYRRNLCKEVVEENWGKIVCDRWYLGNDRIFRACKSLFKK